MKRDALGAEVMGRMPHWQNAISPSGQTAALTGTVLPSLARSSREAASLEESWESDAQATVRRRGGYWESSNFPDGLPVILGFCCRISSDPAKLGFWPVTACWRRFPPTNLGPGRISEPAKAGFAARVIDSESEMLLDSQ